jgi:hypothetical protein
MGVRLLSRETDKQLDRRMDSLAHIHTGIMTDRQTDT